jgi:hypothetical protein
MPSDQNVNRSRAAELCGVSVDSVRRRQRAGDYPNQFKDDTCWWIPVSDLVAAGHLDPTTPAAPQPGTQPDASSGVAGPDAARLQCLLDAARDEIEYLRSTLTALIDTTGKVT